MHKEKLKDIAEITMGTSPSGDTYNEGGNGLPLLNGPTEFGQMSPNCTLFTTDSKRECKNGDLIFCVRGSTTGRMNWADQLYSLGRGVCSIRGNSKLETKYVKYTLGYSLRSLLKLAGGGTFPNLTKTTIHNFEIPYPGSRFKIASILSAFDNLISTNSRRIEILEEMARRIYHEWFVHFKYPGHENDELVDSGTELGDIPEGWSTVKLGEVLDINKGKNITKKTTNPGNVPVVAGGLTPAYTHDTPNTKHPVITASASGANAGYVNLYEVDVWASDCSYIDLNATSNIYYYYSLMVNNQDKIFHMQHGSAQPHVYPKDLKRLIVVEPINSLREEFEKVINPIFSQRKTLNKQNKKLKETRDLLLPKLISGKIDVEEITVN